MIPRKSLLMKCNNIFAVYSFKDSKISSDMNCEQLLFDNLIIFETFVGSVKYSKKKQSSFECHVYWYIHWLMCVLEEKKTCCLSWLIVYKFILSLSLMIVFSRLVSRYIDIEYLDKWVERSEHVSSDYVSWGKEKLIIHSVRAKKINELLPMYTFVVAIDLLTNRERFFFLSVRWERKRKKIINDSLSFLSMIKRCGWTRRKKTSEMKMSYRMFHWNNTITIWRQQQKKQRTSTKWIFHLSSF
jgi:hypothetical protein